MIDSELRALVSLLDEPNESNYINIQNRIFAYGADVIPVLEEVWENTFDELIQYRIENIIHTINFNQIKSDLGNWLKNDNIDILKAYILLSKFQYPDIKEDIITDRINTIKMDIWLEINPNLTALEQIKVINHVLFDIHHFRANKDNPNSFNFLFINNLLESKTGTPLSLGILYMVLSQSLHLPIYGVDLPQNFVLCFTKGINQLNRQDILFYINPFNKGIVFSYKEIDLFIKQMQLEENDKYYLPCSNIQIVSLLLKAMKSNYLKNADDDRVMEINELLNILEAND